jgi:hypothetical protein
MRSERGNELAVIENNDRRAVVLPKLVTASFMRAIVLTLLLPSTGLALSPAAPLANFPTDAHAPHCPANIVFWLKLPTGIYHAKGQRRYSRTKSGAYVCRYIVRVPRQQPAKPCVLQIGGCKRPRHTVAALQLFCRTRLVSARAGGRVRRQ